MTSAAGTVAVAGAGGWGTALAIHLAGLGRRVVLWARRPEIAARLAAERVNARLLPGVAIPAGVEITADAARLCDGARDAIVVAVPTSGLRDVADRLTDWRATGGVIVSLAKGFDPGSLRRPTQLLAESLGARAGELGVLSGPSHAEEVARGLPTAVVAASESPATAARIQAVFFSPRLRVYSVTDPVGVELGGALKNVIAVACGVAEGLGLGDNTRAALITRGLAEMTRLGVALGARRETFMGLAGLGDLVVTCTSDLSRNRRLGRRLGAGETLPVILAGMEQVAEGVNACRAARALARDRGVRMPITEQLHAILFEGAAPASALRDLLDREARSEDDPPA